MRTAGVRRQLRPYHARPSRYRYPRVEIFDRVVVAVYATPQKNLLFTPDQRVELIREATAHPPNVDVAQFGLLVDYARENGIQVIVKGSRHLGFRDGVPAGAHEP